MISQRPDPRETVAQWLGHWDVIQLDDDHAAENDTRGYPARYRGLVLQYYGVWIRDVDSLPAAHQRVRMGLAEHFLDRTIPFVWMPAPGYTDHLRWTAQIVTGDDDPDDQHSPAPQPVQPARAGQHGRRDLAGAGRARRADG